RGNISTWDRLFGALATEVEDLKATKGRGLRILTETVTSPTLAAQLSALLEEFPEAKWHQYEPVNRQNAYSGAELAFGEIVDTIYHFDKADVILTLDGDFLSDYPASVRYSRDFSNRRRVVQAESPQSGDEAQAAARSGEVSMCRLYAVESAPTLAGAIADHRMPLRPSQIETLARAVAERLGVKVATS